MIIDKIAKDICTILHLKDSSQVAFALQLCKEKGVLDTPEVREFANNGIPVINIGARMLHIDIKQFTTLVVEHKISYGDTCIILGAFAQQVLVESQSLIAKRF